MPNDPLIALQQQIEMARARGICINCWHTGHPDGACKIEYDNSRWCNCKESKRVSPRDEDIAWLRLKLGDGGWDRVRLDRIIAVLEGAP